MRQRAEIVEWIDDYAKQKQGQPITVNEKREKEKLMFELLLDIRDVVLQIHKFN